MEAIETAMQLIMHGGNAKSCAMEAIYAAKEGNFEEADKKLQEAEEALLEAHKVQTSMLIAEANGEKLDIGILVIHSQDHLMNAITCKDLATEVVELYKKILK